MRVIRKVLFSNLLLRKISIFWKFQNSFLHLIFLFLKSTRDFLYIDLNFKVKIKCYGVPYYYPGGKSVENWNVREFRLWLEFKRGYWDDLVYQSGDTTDNFFSTFLLFLYFRILFHISEDFMMGILCRSPKYATITSQILCQIHRKKLPWLLNTLCGIIDM